jgi:hypothetical protein
MSSPAALEKEDDDPLLLCPACGFDLRGTPGDRCGECGLDIDRAGLRVSGIAWAHRDRMGRVPAYVKTARAFAGDRNVRYEGARPQEIRDGRAFARVTACLVAAALVGAFAAGLYAAGGLVALGIQPQTASLGSTLFAYDGRALNVMLPWSAGATIPGVLPACLIALAFWLTAAPRFVFRMPAATEERARAAVALSHYATAPLLLLLPAVVSWAGLTWLIRHAWGAYSAGYPRAFMKYPRASLALAVSTGVIVIAALGLSLLRIGQWRARTRLCGMVRAVLGVGEVVGLWLLGAVVLLGLAPWTVGFAWIAIDSLR